MNGMSPSTSRYQVHPSTTRQKGPGQRQVAEKPGIGEKKHSLSIGDLHKSFAPLAIEGSQRILWTIRGRLQYQSFPQSYLPHSSNSHSAMRKGKKKGEKGNLSLGVKIRSVDIASILTLIRSSSKRDQKVYIPPGNPGPERGPVKVTSSYLTRIRILRKIILYIHQGYSSCGSTRGGCGSDVKVNAVGMRHNKGATDSFLGRTDFGGNLGVGSVSN